MGFQAGAMDGLSQDFLQARSWVPHLATSEPNEIPTSAKPYHPDWLEGSGRWPVSTASIERPTGRSPWIERPSRTSRRRWRPLWNASGACLISGRVLQAGASLGHRRKERSVRDNCFATSLIAYPPNGDFKGSWLKNVFLIGLS